VEIVLLKIKSSMKFTYHGLPKLVLTSGGLTGALVQVEREILSIRKVCALPGS
jgi:hypothetical protein